MFACGSRDETLGCRSRRLLRVGKMASAGILDSDSLSGWEGVACDDRPMRHTFWLLLEPVSRPIPRRLVECFERLAAIHVRCSTEAVLDWSSFEGEASDREMRSCAAPSCGCTSVLDFKGTLITRVRTTAVQIKNSESDPIALHKGSALRQQHSSAPLAG
jgi:hypothetical protein